jgi:hypothetical protein
LAVWKMSALVRYPHSFSKDRIAPRRWLDKLAALNQPPQVDRRNVVLGQVFRTH